MRRRLIERPTLNLTRLILFTSRVRVLTDFYSTTFDLPLIGEMNDDWVEVQAGGCLLAFHKTTYNTEDKDDTGLKLVFGADYIEEERRRLIDLGLEMGAIQRFGDLAFCDGSDPDGNRFQLSNRTPGSQ